MKRLTAIMLLTVSPSWGAIAFDAASQISNSTSFFCASPPCTKNWTHTCTGSNLLLTVEVTFQGTAPSITSMTYNGVALTTGVVAGNGTATVSAIWYLVGPATGANTVSVSMAGGGAIGGMAGAVSLTGVNQSTPIDVSTAGPFGSATSVSYSKTTTVDNDWFVDSNYIFNTNAMTSTSGTARWGFIDSGNIAASTTSTRGPLTPAGSFSMGYSWTNATNGDFAVIAVEPVAAASAAASQNRGLVINGVKTKINGAKVTIN